MQASLLTSSYSATMRSFASGPIQTGNETTA